MHSRSSVRPPGSHAHVVSRPARARFPRTDEPSGRDPARRWRRLFQPARTLALLLALAALGPLAAHAQVSTNATNSTVRFRLALGSTLVGDIDVELFDTEKPITVSNFLSYAQSGSYSRSILHRVVPGFVLQGGGYTVPSPLAAASFQVVNQITENAPITNEFARSTLRSNVLGTIAMAKPGNDPNGATCQWFFNLGDNTRGTGATNLNTANGGYTVFGRVTAGTQVLQFFNERGVNNGVLNMNSAFYRTFCSAVFVNPNGGLGYPFDALPVGFTGQGCPNYSDLFNVEIIILSARDVVPPKIAITSPAANASFTNENITARGTVSDNAGVATVRLYRGTNQPVTATVTNGTWTALLTNLPPGTNAILAEAVDTSGLRGQAALTFFRSVRTPLNLAIVGSGTVSGATNGQRLEIGRGYTLTAKPSAGHLFAGWEDDASGDNPKLNFLMASNQTITAVFATNLFPLVRGTYQGLFHHPEVVEVESAGALSLTLGSAGTYSAKLLLQGRTFPFKGTFSPDGRETNLVARTGTNALRIELAVDLEGGSDQLTGSITNNQGTAGIDTNRAWFATLLADRAVFHPATNPAPQAGRYTLLIPPDTNAPAAPPAHGFGSATVATPGTIAFSGTLPDGTKISQKSTVSRHGTWPVYIPLAKGAGAIVSWLTFTNDVATETDLTGLLTWIKPAQPGTRYYAAGLTNESTVAGARFIPGSTTNRVLELSTGIVTVADGDLATPFANDILLDAAGKATNLDTNKLTLVINKATGLFTGTATPPGSTRSLPLKGAVLQRQNRGAGFFLGTNTAGTVTIEAATP